MKKILYIFIPFFLFGLSFPLFADEMHKPYVGSKEFERMKQLVGSWEGSMDMGKGLMPIKASYKLTGADSALVETFHEGTPHEMVSIYHDNKNKMLTMTHYCAEHNQPKLVLKGTDNNKMTLDLSPDSDIDVAHESHIHSASIQFDGSDSMTQTWTSFKGGTKDQVVKITFKRSK